MQAPDWFRKAAGPHGLRPPPPGVVEASGAGGPTLPSVPPAAKGPKSGSVPTLPRVPAAPQGPNAGGASSQQLALLPPPPAAKLPGPPSTPKASGSVALSLVASQARGAAAQALAVVNAVPNGPGSVNQPPFRIPGLQDRPFSVAELESVWRKLDLDQRGFIDTADLRRALGLCGHADASDAEVCEMIRICDPDGSGGVDFMEFQSGFQNPIALWRNYDFDRVDDDDGLGQQAEPRRGSESSAAASSRLTSHDPSVVGVRLGQRKGPDPRLEAIATLTGGKKLKPDFIRQLYHRFVEIDTRDDGLVSFDHFCIVFRKPHNNDMRQAFRAFDPDRLGELDLRQFIIGLSWFTSARLEDKLRFAFMMYDEEQRGTISREELRELLAATDPYMPPRERESHASRVYAMYNLHPFARIAFDELLQYLLENENHIVPGADVRKSAGAEAAAGAAAATAAPDSSEKTD